MESSVSLVTQTSIQPLAHVSQCSTHTAHTQHTVSLDTRRREGTISAVLLLAHRGGASRFTQLVSTDTSTVHLLYSLCTYMECHTALSITQLEKYSNDVLFTFRQIAHR
jgi:hypothetical protein